MKYISTRGNAPAISFEEALLSGPAPDGGLYVPEKWPTLDWRRLKGRQGLDYPLLAGTILAHFCGEPAWHEAIERATRAAYARFSDPRVAPLRELGPNRWLLELFHGPTLAFKDFALQVLGPLMNEALVRRGRRALVVAATSGDTGAAAVHALAGQSNIDLVVLHPRGRISEVQRRQMTTTTAANIRNIAVEGTFDDAQAMVKAAFADAGFAHRHGLAAINSINWVRIAVQSAYYVAAHLALGRPGLSFAVPTGNFGDAFAGEVARRMGMPLRRIIVATNSNDIVARAINTGVYARGRVHATLSPAMDIQVASNFERLLHAFHRGDAARTAALMQQFERDGSLTLDPEVHEALRAVFAADAVTQAETLATIRLVHERVGLILDPHTAVGLTATRIAAQDEDVVTLATAHPAKFPDVVENATGIRVDLPASLQWIKTATERCEALPARVEALKDWIGADPFGRGPNP
jgi:threonine synthase